jgi:hypothetical protein
MRANYQSRMNHARKARNDHIGASFALIELSRGRPQTQPSRRSSPTNSNPFRALDSNLDTADEAQLLKLRNQTQAILAKIGQRLDGPKAADTNGTTDEQDVDMTLGDQPMDA